MPTRAQKIRLGIFVIVSFAGLLILIVIVTRQQFLEDRDIYYIAYENVSVGGLEVGSPVKYLGIRVGIVEDIRINPQNIEQVIVEVELKPGTPIKTDARADINTIGITGLKTIEIRGGSQEAELLEPGSFIPPGHSLTEEITGKAEVLARKFEHILNNLQDFTRPENLRKFTQMVDQVNSAFKNTDSILQENRKDLRFAIRKSQEISARMDTSSQLLLSSMEEVHRIVGSDTLQQILGNAREVSLKLKEANLVALIGQLREVADRTNRILSLMDEGMERGGRDFMESMEKLKLTADYLQEFSRTLQEDPSVIIRGTEYKNLPDRELDE